ncbi:TIGR04168 family protein [Synechococcus sp. CCY9202]|uniref:TIGR04168 family protein n=1 Tax=Synechococcus sp. CCY9202 TaxID=174698 RepID=UPI002B20558D|nr:TIGR04168 family protein [Synechococcus sp. CCY9202]MEA5423182.1 TIGR04168 family protein [Synechococcus sp. CCY9202]
MRIAIAGDPHDQWDQSDHALLELIRPDALLLVGDFSDGKPRIPSLLRRLELPLACILGNHDSGHDSSGRTLQRQLDLLGDLHCGWDLRQLSPPGLAVVGARPGSAGGGFHLSRAVRAVFGPVEMRESARRICEAALSADPSLPLLVLSHCGPSGLGSEPGDPCGRDWKASAGDWGDQDLALALEGIRRQRSVPLVVFGHMHHALRRGQGERRSFCRDRSGTAYLNTACVPRHGEDQAGRTLRHFSWVEFRGVELAAVSHRWYGLDGSLLYEQKLWRSEPANGPAPLAAPAAACSAAVSDSTACSSC